MYATRLLSFFLLGGGEPQTKPANPRVVAVVEEGEFLTCLASINARRDKAGLPPYIYDPQLAAAALEAAKYRAAHCMFDHTENDFCFLPKGVLAKASGCAAYPRSYGLMACGMYDREYTRCGAAWVKGTDGRYYTHCFYR